MLTILTVEANRTSKSIFPRDVDLEFWIFGLPHMMLYKHGVYSINLSTAWFSFQIKILNYIESLDTCMEH